MVRKKLKTLAAAKRLRTLGTLVKLHVAIAEDVAAGSLSPKEADRITRLCGKFLRESKKSRRLPSEAELSELGAAVVALLRGLETTKRHEPPPVSDLVITKDGSVVIDRGHAHPDCSDAAIGKSRPAKGRK